METKPEESSKPAQVDVSKARNFPLGSSQILLSARNAIIYSLGIGLGKEPLNSSERDFVYELSDSFRVFPTMATVLSDGSDIFDRLQACPGIPEFNPAMLLHGEEELTITRPLKEETTYYVEAVIEDVLDKQKGALVMMKVSGFEDKEKTKPAFVKRTNVFIRGIGGFAPQAKSDAGGLPPVPKSPPDFTLEHKTELNQAAVYRLSGDFNPLHIDPDMASMGGFDRPILHGLCFFGISAQLIVRHLAGNEVEKFKAMRARFVGHVFPGETLQVSCWLKAGGSEVVFSTQTKERGKQVAVGVLSLKEAPKPKL